MAATQPGLFTARIIRTVRLSQLCRMVVFERPPGFPDAAPGQFIALRVTGTISPLLRRPYSIMDLRAGELELLVKVVGTGSGLIADAPTGSAMEIAGPLGGTSFPAPGDRPAVLAAGGAGLAPLIFAARTWRRAGHAGRIELVYGSECDDELPAMLCGDDFSAVHRATIDGSCGYCGDAVQLLETLLAGGNLGSGILYSCGPRGMVRALQRRAAAGFKRHFTSLEAVMACGVGACRGCAVPLLGPDGPPFAAVCSDGTVFDAAAIDWEGWDE